MSIAKLTLGRTAGVGILFIAVASAGFAQTREKERKPVELQTDTQKTSSADTENEDPQFKGMKYRLVGPFRGGRSLTAAGVTGDPNTYYFGSTGGGVWKSSDGAMTWAPVFDKQTVASIGSLAVASSDPNVVYVGTGEACIRGNISHGDGIFKTVDGGKTWKNVGLRDSRAIGKVIVDPQECGCCVCGGARPSLWPKHGAGDLPHNRRGQELGEGSVQRREHGGNRYCV
jgi:photosystem II stability/assembly factor-like uncharacterized protein